MSTGLIRNLILARAISVEPIARALCPDPLDLEREPFARSTARWRLAAVRAARECSIDNGETDEAIDCFARR